jgi:DNA-binding NarL/FixJ family response regulator
VARSVLATIRERIASPDPARADLSDREAEVLRALVAGKGYKEIGFDLSISVDTVRTHIRRIYGKLQVHSAPAAVARAIRDRIV